MNTLSWLIYLSDILPSLSAVFTGISFVLFAVTGIVIAAVLCTLDDYQSSSSKPFRSFAKYAGISALFCCLIVIAIPTKQTILMIAASEFGEEITRNTEVQDISGKAYQALDKFISDYIKKN